MLGEGIEEGGLGDRFHEHVGFVDGLPAANGGAVESQAFFEYIRIEFPGGYGKMLPEAGKVHESKVNNGNLLAFDEVHHLLGGAAG